MLLLIWVVVMTMDVKPAVSQNSGSLHVDCDFGLLQNSTNTHFVTQGNLTPSFGNARSCRIQHNASAAFVRVELTRVNKNISTIYSIVVENTDITFVGTARDYDLVHSDGYQFHACPVVNSPDQGTELKLYMFGSPGNVTFQLGVDLDETFLSAGQSKDIVLQSNDAQGEVLAFDIQKDNLFKLLQISVSSTDDNIECYLIVSRSCANVQRQLRGIAQDTKDKQLKLTFTKYGRITLSQFSSPKIEAGRWYIGVMVTNVMTRNSERKTLTVTVDNSYGYDTLGKGLPAGYMCLIAIIVGLAIAVFAHFFLNTDFDEMCPPSHNKDEQQDPNVSISEFIPAPIPWKYFPCKRWAEVVFIHWFSKGMKTYSYLTAVLAIAFMVGSAQFVIGRWSDMIASGDRDKCFYNERCYRPIAFADLPSNFMVSNVPYVLHGVILSISFSLREAIALDFYKPKRGINLQVKGEHVPYDYSIAYALSWALIFQGIFSATYHLCPSRMTFQFDSAFMFIISGLVVIALYNSRIKKREDTGNDRPAHDTIIQAPKYFLFFVAPILLLNYVGSIRDTTGLPPFVEGLYWVFLVLWIILIYIWAFKKIGVPCGRGTDCVSNAEHRLKWFWLVIFPICLIIIGFSQFGDWSQFFLFACVAAVVLSIAGLMTLNLTLSVKQYRSYDAVDGSNPLCDPKAILASFLANIHRVFFMIVLFLFWVFAMYFFKLKPTTKKTAAPSFSRTRNQECILWDFFDYHDIWHMLSSFALFMSAYLLIYMCSKVERYAWVEMQYDKRVRSYQPMSNKMRPPKDEAPGPSSVQEGCTKDDDVTHDDVDLAGFDKGKHPTDKPRPLSHAGELNLTPSTESLEGFKDYKVGQQHYREAFV
ncbi:uncharacterized protein LOC5501597 isoform X2 [Nematostella vectensis]|nr:uncharacterized protein LOC5501597 isoform X2 [Nematostella vectensis]XP_032225790.2 uncharacterized protein LOC5501597 isoform X2 [Nematostella vectensis]XP_032225791.2 uncharacterized protein LOC5501597 isoform X2 [Nematostella vectensis]XP_032225792.2 uncharacterized protein LOC5501597 isoform X2 [Nematostella vectensis]XP_032225793.2 uncharacterized protein LOC5501597 isoform X2 [Nematostella vectensis]